MTESNSAIDRDPENTTVFFSYSRVDQMHALPIIDAIEAAGYRVWWDGMLEGGTNFLETTEQALESAKAVVVLWSKTSVSSHWVRDEATSGRVRDRLIPLTLDGTIAPLGFRQVQLIDFQNWKGDLNAPNMMEMTRTLAALHGEAVPLPTGTPHIPLQQKPVSRRNLLLAAGGAFAFVGIGGAAFIGNQQMGSPKLLANGIAVLPFENLSGDESQDYISNGLASEVRAKLARNEALRVVSRSSAESVAREGLDAKSIAKRLSVANILEGSIRKVDDHINVTVELTDGRSGFNRWTETYKHAETDVLGVHNQIADGLVKRLSDQDIVPMFDPKSGETQNAEAFNEYLKGVALFRSNISEASNLRALDHFNRATELDPNFGAALTTKARLLHWLSATSPAPEIARTYSQAAVETARDATFVSPKMPNAFSTLGYILFGQLDVKAAKAPYEHARSLGIFEATDYTLYASYMTAIGRDAEAMEAIKRAVDLDPLNATVHRVLGIIHYAARRYDLAIAASRRALEINPKHVNANARIGLSLLAKGEIDEGLLSCEKEPNDLERLTCLAIGEHKRGDDTLADEHYANLVQSFGDAGTYQQAQIMAQWGRYDDAMQLLEKAFNLKDSGLTLLAIDPALDPLREQTAFIGLLDKLGFSA